MLPFFASFFLPCQVEHLVHPQKPHHPASQPRGPGAPPGSSKAAAGPGSAAGVAGEGEGEGEDVEDGDVLTNIATSGSPIDLAASNATADMDSLEGSTGSTAEESSTGGIGIGDAGAAQLNQPLQQPDQHHHKQHHHHLHIHPGWDLLAGSAAGATAVLATYPLDLIRTRLAWASPGLSSSTPSSAGGAAASSSSSVPGASSGTAAAPHPTGKGSASAASIRSSSSHGHGARPAELSIRGAFIATAKSEGMVGLFKGLGPTLLGILPYAGLKFYVYQSLKAWYRQQGQGAAHADAASSSDSASSSTSSGSGVGTGGASGAGAAQEGGKGRHRSGGRLPVHIMLAFGGISGLAAQTVTYPLDVVRRRMQVDGLAGQRPSQAAGSSSISGGSSGSSGGATGSNGSSSGGPGGESGHARSMHAAASAQGSHACAAWPVGTQHQQLKRGTLATAQLIVREEGMRGLFRGLSLNYIKVVWKGMLGLGWGHCLPCPAHRSDMGSTQAAFLSMCTATEAGLGLKIHETIYSGPPCTRTHSCTPSQRGSRTATACPCLPLAGGALYSHRIRLLRLAETLPRCVGQPVSPSS